MNVVGPWLAIVIVSSLPSLGAGDVDGDGVDDVADVCSNTPPGVMVDSAGRPRADLDDDCDIDFHDYFLFARDFSGMCLPEICDGLDNDCDALPDNDAFSNDVEDCADGLDNDCDDMADCEDVSACPATTPCAVGNRVCNDFGFCDCLSGFDDCNQNIADGCETDLMSDVDHCLACDRPCAFDHAIPACEAGVCVLDQCDGLWGNCNGFMEDGCERALNTTSNCAACNQSCSLPHASATCSTGACAIAACHSGWANCDNQVSDGCEYSLAIDHGTCTAPNYVSGWTGPVCGDNRDSIGTSGLASRWAFAGVADCDGGIVIGRQMGVTIELQSPPGVNYDLYVYGPCATLRGSSTNGAGQLDTVEYGWADGSGDDSRDVAMEIRFVNGSSCSPWTLTLTGFGR